MARTGIRAAAIIIKNNKILLMHRKKEGREYWVFPGGGIEEGDSGRETIVREVKEETSLKCKKITFAFKDRNFGRLNPFYFCEVEEGEVVLGGSEAERCSEEDWYNPEWVALGDISEVNLVPESAKKKLLKVIK